MKYKVSIIVENDFPVWSGKIKAKDAVEKFGLIVSDVEVLKETRSNQQNKALHKFFKLLADELNEKGMDMRAVLSKENPISWTPHTVKENMWRPLQKALVGKESTRKLLKGQEIDLIIDNLNRILVERTKGEVVLPEFPSKKNILK